MLITYEHLLTLDTEVKEMWNRKVTPTTVLFFVNRYVLLLTITVTFLEQTKWNDLSNSVSPFSQNAPEILFRL